LHEYMHGRAADFFGDKTARNAGRLTLNPVPHIDPFGTILLPLALLLLSGGTWMFGYAKPVPVNPYFMRKPRDMVWVSIAGPATNFAIAAVVTAIGAVCNAFGVHSIQLFMLLFTVAEINIILGVFNLIPVPPLDGSHVVAHFLKGQARTSYERFGRYGFILIFGLLVLVGGPFFRLLNPLFRLVASAMGLTLA